MDPRLPADGPENLALSLIIRTRACWWSHAPLPTSPRTVGGRGFKRFSRSNLSAQFVVLRVYHTHPAATQQEKCQPCDETIQRKLVKFGCKGRWYRTKVQRNPLDDSGKTNML